MLTPAGAACLAPGSGDVLPDGGNALAPGKPLVGRPGVGNDSPGSKSSLAHAGAASASTSVSTCGLLRFKAPKGCEAIQPFSKKEAVAEQNDAEVLRAQTEEGAAAHMCLAPTFLHVCVFMLVAFVGWQSGVQYLFSFLQGHATVEHLFLQKQGMHASPTLRFVN